MGWEPAANFSNSSSEISSCSILASLRVSLVKYMEMWKNAGIKVIPVVASAALAKRMERFGLDDQVFIVLMRRAFLRADEDGAALHRLCPQRKRRGDPARLRFPTQGALA